MAFFSLKSFRCIAAFIVCSLFLGMVSASAATPSALPQSNDELRVVLKQLFQDHPDLVLDVLRENSEEVLEIAQQGNMQRKRKAISAQWMQDATVPKNINLAEGFSRGVTNAPVTIVAFSDFTCSFCRQAEVILTQVLQKHKKDVRFVFKPLPKEDYELSMMASKYVIAAFMQDTDKAWKYYDAIFSEVEKLERDGDNYLKAAAVKVNLNLPKLVTDSNSKAVMEQLAAVRQEADRLEIQGTPYFFVNDLVIRGSVPKDIFDDAVLTALKLRK